MTSQVVLFNGHGVAVASDSTQTSGELTLDTAEKIFPAPEPHQIALIISNSAVFQGYPVSVLINEWFNTLGKKRQPSSRHYFQSFIDFIDNSGLINEERQDASLLQAIQNVFERVEYEFDRPVPVEEQGLSSAIKRVHDSWPDDRLAGADSTLLSFITNGVLSNGRSFHNVIMDLFAQWKNDKGDSYIPPLEIVDAMSVLVMRYLANSLWDEPRTEVVVMGFGEYELMPSFYRRDIRGHIAGRTLGRFYDESTFDDDGLSPYVGYRPLAQSDAIFQFVRGFAEEIFHEAKGSTSSSVSEVFAGLESRPDELAAEVTRLSVESVAKAFYESDRTQRFLSTISVLPTASLASVAQFLIQVQAFSVLLKGEQRTVGGPIDTAIITRSDGFRWIRHKSLEL